MKAKQSGGIEVPCPLCSSKSLYLYTDAPSHYGPEKHSVSRCSECGMIFTNPQSKTYLEEVENRGALARHFQPKVIKGMCRQAHFLLRLIKPFSSGNRLLDFGSGAGGMVHTALHEGWDAIGYDLNGGLVAAANDHWQFSALQTGPLEEFYTKYTGAFDAIISYQVFEHLQEPLITGKRLFSLLKPGGILLIDVPNVFQPGEWFSKGRTLDPTAHWCHFSTATLSTLIRKIGCEVVYSSAAPSLVSLYHKMGMTKMCFGLGLLTKRVLPPLGSGVCVIGRRPI
jgi:2-polyprenyl-3-methyl-5-hydroxy-6-metoxy-1,4-benzoquinol methylase